MKKLNNPTENFVSKRINQRRVRCWVALLSALVLFLTVNTLKLEADTLERIATCGIEQHVHDESCYDASGALICGLAEHAHTDACFQQRPQRHDLTRVDGFMPLNAKVTLATPMPKLTSNSADGQDAVQAEADYYSDIPTEVGSGIEPPVDEIETELAGEDAAPAVEDAVPLEIVYEDQAEETVQQPEYVINGSTVLLSDILSVLGMKASGIQTVGELEGDTFAEDPVNFAVEATQNDYELRVLRDFDAAELGVMTDDEVIIITLKNGIAPVEDNDDENPSENDDINIEETHTGETDDEAAADETVDEETEDSADEATEETVDELTEDTDDEETEEAADEMTVDATEEETVETVEETETAAVVPDKLVALDFADYDCLADATVYFYAPDRGAVLVNAEELAEADGVHLTVNAPVVLSMEADLGLADLGLAELEAALEEAPEDIDVRIGENPVLFENGVLIISGDGELTVNGVTYSVTNVTLPSRSVESDNIIISTVDDQATLLGVTPAFEDNGEDEGDIYALFAAQMDENIVTATSEEIQVDAIEPAKGLLRSSAMMATTDAAPEAEEAVADAEETVADAEETVEETAETETAEAAVETRTLKVRVYDVSLIREGESVEPDAPIHVETTFDAPLEGENFQLYHIVDGKPEEVDGFVKTDDQGRAIGMSFDTASLSPFAVVYYTVEYTTDNNEVTVKLDFTDIVRNGADFDTNSVITALNDGVSVSISELEQGYIEGADSVVNGELYIDYTTADNKNENIKNVNWIGFKVVECSDGLNVVDGKIKVTKDGTVVLSDGISTVTVVISNYEKLVAKELTSQGVDITVLNGEVPAGSEVSYTALDEAKTSELVEQYNIDSDVEGVAHTAFDVSIAMPEGGNYAESGEFAVAVDLPVDEKAGDFKLYHIHEGQVEELPVEVVDGKVLFTTSSFSEFVLSYTVDFEYNGYKFSMPGGGVLLLSELFEQLHIEEDVADVVDVTSSNDALLTAVNYREDGQVSYEVTSEENLSEEDVLALEPNTVISIDKDVVTINVRSGDWVLRSLAPFTSHENLKITLSSGEFIVINMDDAQYGDANINFDNANNTVNMTDIATVRTSASKTVTQNEQERDAVFDIAMGVMLSKSGLDALQKFVIATGNVPAIVYDFSSALKDNNGNYIAMPTGGTQDLKEDGEVVGTITITSDGKAIIQYNSADWVKRKTAIGANINYKLETQESNIPSDDTWTFEFPDSNDIEVHYKKTYTVEGKQYELSGDGENGYTVNYSAKFTNAVAMDKLQFTDELGSDDMQKLDAGSIRISYTSADGSVTNQDVTGQFTKNATDKGFTLKKEGNEGSKVVPAGEYVVTYTTHITAEQYAAMQEGTSSWETNTAKWKVNGGSDIPGGETSFNIDKPKPPEPPVEVDKSSNQENKEVAPGGEIEYTVTYKTRKLAGLRIYDKMTDAQILQGGITVKIDGNNYALPGEAIKYTDDHSYSQWNDVDVYDYTFPDNYPDDGNEHTITITYKTKVIDQDTAKENNIFDAISVNNVGHEGRYWTNDKTTSTVTYDKEVIHTVDKSVTSSAVTAEGKWEPGANLTYTIKIGDGTTDLSGARVIDKMTDLQRLDLDSVQIKYGDDGTYGALSSGIVYNDDGQYSVNDTDVLDLVLPTSAGYGPVYITYTTHVLTQQELKDAGLTINDDKNVNNNVQVGEKGHDGTTGIVTYPPEPKFPLTKEITTRTYVDLEEGETPDGSTPTPLNGDVHYRISFGDETIDMAGVKIRDEMTDVQKLVGDVVVSWVTPLPEAITLSDGTVVPAGSTSFVMPNASSAWGEDGVVWAAYNDNGKYSVSGTERVFYFTLPSGIGNGPIYVDYDVKVITEAEAKASGILDEHTVYNTAVSGNNSQTVEYPVEFPKDVKHTPKAEKKFVRFDFENRRVYWDIVIDKTDDSAFPLENVVVKEVLSNNTKVTSPETSNYAVKPSDFNLLDAVVTTASGNVLEMGVDYTIDKGSDSPEVVPSFTFPKITEKTTIRLYFSTPYAIVDSYYAKNIANVAGTDVPAETTYTTPEWELYKTGDNLTVVDADGKERHVIKWSVVINPRQKEVPNDTYPVMFEDLIPAGLKVINYLEWVNNRRVDYTHPSVHVDYSGNSFDGNSGDFEVTLDEDGNIQSTRISLEYHPTESGPYNPATGQNDPKPNYVFLNKLRSDVYYYTEIDDAEWERITSSAAGQKTYENKVTISTDGEKETSGTVTVKDEHEYISKTDTTVAGEYEGKDGKTHTGVVILTDDQGNIVKDGDKNQGSNNISYKIEVNPNAVSLNRVDPEDEGEVTYEPIVLTDRIDTNMDFDPTSLVIYVYGTPGDESTLTPIADLSAAGLSVTYNDDNRLLTISGLADKTAYRVVYHNVVRAQGEDTFTNTATLTGGGSHSSTASEKHKFETFNDDSVSYDMELDLRKIKETNVTEWLANVTFELHKLTLASDPSEMTDAQWQALYAATNKSSYVGEDRFKIVDDVLIDTQVTDADNRGVVEFPSGAIKIEPMTLYYWIETENGNEGYKAENTPHYFVLYPEMEIVWVDADGEVTDEEHGIRTIKRMLSDEEKTKQQRYAWALDNATQAANNITVASLGSGATWSVTNLEEKYTNIAAEKKWAGDIDNLYETRPTEGIKLTLMRKKGENGMWEIYKGTGVGNETKVTNPVIVRPTKYQTDKLDENGNVVMNNGNPVKVWVEEWPTVNWPKLPAYEVTTVADIDDGITEVQGEDYYYKVVEAPVKDYTVAYTQLNGTDVDVENDGIQKGIVVLTNTYIPPTTKVSVHKKFAISEGTSMPEQIVVHLYRYKKDAEGTVSGPDDYGYTKMLTAQNNWTETFSGLPTRDGDGNTYSYTVVEDTDALEDAGFTYTLTEYELDGDIDFGGLVSGTVEITNHGPGSLKIEKNVTINGKAVDAGDTGADGTYTFHILKDGVEITDTYEDEGGNTVAKSPVTITIENGVSNSVVVSGLAAGEYTIHEDVPAGMSLTGGNDIVVKVVGGVDDPAEVETAEFTNNVDKTWVNANRDANGEKISGVNNDWPRGVTVEMYLYKTDGSTDTLVTEDKNGNAITNPVVLNAVRQSYIFDDLEDLTGTAYSYKIVEGEITGAPDGANYTAFVNQPDEDGNAQVINAEDTRVEITKKWENTKYDASAGADKVGSDYIYFNRAFLTIDVKLHRYYMKDGVLTETPYTPEEQATFNTTITMDGNSANESASANETTTAGDDVWKLVWAQLPTVGLVDEDYVSYIYKAEEEKVWFTGADNVKQDVTEKYLTKQSDDLTIANRYDKDTSVEVEKLWSDGNGKHTTHKAEFTLYRSKIGPDGTGTPYTGTISVPLSGWEDTDGNSLDALPTSGSITATVTREGAATGVQYELNSGNGWTVTDIPLKQGYTYNVSYTVDGTTVKSYSVTSADDVFSKDANVEKSVITLSAVAAAKEYTITVLSTHDGSYTPYICQGKTKTGIALIDIYFGTSGQLSTLGGMSLTTEDTGVNVTVTLKEAVTRIRQDWGGATETLGFHIQFRVSDITDDIKLTLNDNNFWPKTKDEYCGDYQNTVSEVEKTASRSSAPLRRLAAAASVNPSEITVPGMPAQVEPVTAAMVTGGITNPVDLTFSENAQENWKYIWAGLPETDSTDGEPWFYYVKETGFNFGSDEVTIEDVQYDITYSDVKPRTVTKVKVTNVVKEDEGKLEVTKNAPGIPASDKQKVFRFTVTNEDGLYVQKTNSNEVSAREKWFEIKAEQTITFDPLIVGKYTVTEDASTEAAGISGYKLVATGGGEVTVEKNGTASSTLTNTYTEEKGSLKVAKTFNGLTYDQLTPEQKQALAKVSFTVKNASNETIATIYLKVDESNMGADLTKTISNLKPGAYTVTENIPDDSDPSGYEYKTTTVNVTGGTGTSGDKSATTTVEANKTVTVTFDNEYDESTADLTVTKNLSKANTSGSDLTFYVGLFTDSQGTALATQTDVGGTNPQEVKVLQNETSGTVTFSALTIGTTYYVFETNASGVKVSTTDKISGYAIQASDVTGKTVTIQPSSNSVSITNTYDATGTATFSGTKSIANRNFKAGDSFTIQVEGADNAPMPGTTEAGSTYTKTVTLTADQAAANTTSFAYTLDAISYSLSDIPSGEMSKQFTYTVTESAATMDGVAAVDSTSYTVTVTISDNGDGTLDVVKSGNYNALNFTNTYDASGSVPFSALKVLSGRKLAAEDYSFELVDSNGAVIQTKQNDANGNVMFDAVNYTLSQLTNGTATFTYTIREVLPNTATSSNNYTVTTGNNTTVYDNHDVTVTVTVTDDGDGTLEVEKTSTYTATSGKDATFTNTEYTKVEVDKKWFQGSTDITDQMSASNASLTVTLSAAGWDGKDVDGNDVQPVNLPVGSNWFTSWDKLPKQDADGNAYTYTVTESNVKVANDDLTAAGAVTVDATGHATINNTLPTTELTVTKEWTSTWPTDVDSVQVTISASGTETAIGTLIAGSTGATTAQVNLTSSDASKTWNNLPFYDNAGNKITYSVAETSVTMTAEAGETAVVYTENTTPAMSQVFTTTYNTVGTTTTITNTPNTTHVPVDKTWLFADDSTTWPEGVTVQVKLMKQVGTGTAEQADTVTLSSSKTNHDFIDLPIYEGLESITYTVEEGTVTGGTLDISKFDVNVTGNATDGFHIANSEKRAGLTITKIVSGKTLTDEEKAAITFTITGPSGFTALTKHLTDFTENPTGTYTLTLNQSNGIEAGATYTVTETGADIQKYTRVTTIASTEYAQGGADPTGTVIVDSVTKSGTITITNAYEGEKKDFIVQKRWMYRNGSWENTFDGGTIYFHLYRTYKDGGNADHTDAVKADGTLGTERQEVSYSDHLEGFTFADSTQNVYIKRFTNLPKYTEDGYEITYTVVECDSIGNEFSQGEGANDVHKLCSAEFAEGTNVTATAIKNELLNFKAKKEWANSNVAPQYYPAVTFTLKRKISSDADWTTLESKTLSAMSAEDAATEANRIVSFDHKYPKYDANGNLYTYQVFETEIAGYTAGDPVLSDQEGASVQLFTVTNTPNTMNLYVHKEWYDGTKAMDNALAGSLAQVQYQVYRQGYLDSEFATACGSEEQITLPSGVTGTLPTSTTTTDETTGETTTTYGWEENVSGLPATGAVDESGTIKLVYYKYYVKEVTTGDFTTSYSTSREGERQSVPSDAAVSGTGNKEIYINNTITPVTVTGTKTWVMEGDAPTTKPTLKLFRTSAKDGSTAEEITEVQPVWTGEGKNLTYTYSGLEKYDGEGYLYTYAVKEASFVVGETTYTVTWDGDNCTVSPAGAFKVEQDGNNINNTELTTASVTKTWAGAEDGSKVESITYHLTRKIGDVEDTTFNSDTANTVTVEKAASGTTDWGKTWDNLDAYGTITYTLDGGSETTVSGSYDYSVDETQFVVKWGDVDSTRATYTVTKSGDTYTVVNPEGDYHFWKATKSWDGFTNTLDETYLDVIKLWSLNGAPATADTEDNITDISFYLYRSDNKVIDSATKQAKATKEEATAFTMTKSLIAESDPAAYEWKLHIAGLEKTDSSGTPYTYWIQEVTVPGYSTTPSITMVSGGNTVNVGPGTGQEKAPAEGTITITNSKWSVSLPSTGGPGTTGFYVLGSILTLLALVLLITKKRTDGAGID